MEKSTPQTSSLPQTVPSTQTSVLSMEETYLAEAGYELLMNPETLSWAILIARRLNLDLRDFYSEFREINKAVGQVYISEREALSRILNATDSKRQ